MADRGSFKVLVCTSLSDSQLARITVAREPGSVADGAALLLRELPDALRPGQKDPPLREKNRSLDELLGEADVLLGARRVPRDIAKRAPRLRWVQMPLAGPTSADLESLWRIPGIVVTSATGINALPVAEYAVMVMMLLVKDARRIIRSQDAGEWDRYDLGQLRGKTLAIIGFGTVGREVARLAEPFDMKRIALKRSVDPREGLPEWVYAADRLPEVLKEADIVTLCVPATAATRGMIGSKQLALMKPSAVLINVARGDVLDEEALAAALKEGRLAGAALDVFNEEPLAPGSPFWKLPNAIVSGHVAGLFESYDDAVVDLFLANLSRFERGEPLLNPIDRRTGY